MELVYFLRELVLSETLGNGRIGFLSHIPIEQNHISFHVSPFSPLNAFAFDLGPYPFPGKKETKCSKWISKHSC